jgi:hypothetical protein
MNFNTLTHRAPGRCENCGQIAPLIECRFPLNGGHSGSRYRDLCETCRGAIAALRQEYLKRDDEFPLQTRATAHQTAAGSRNQ